MHAQTVCTRCSLSPPLRMPGYEATGDTTVVCNNEVRVIAARDEVPL